MSSVAGAGEENAAPSSPPNNNGTDGGDAPQSPSDSIAAPAWLTQFPSTREIDQFIRGTVKNASIARTCMKEAYETKEQLRVAVENATAYAAQCDQRIQERSKFMAQYQAVLNSKRP